MFDLRERNGKRYNCIILYNNVQLSHNILCYNDYVSLYAFGLY
jgi:hypothetical protein